MQPLSKSNLWQHMQEYYNSVGPQAWTEEVVPLQISSNKYLAHIYTNLIIAALDDYNAKHQDINADEPFYIIEIGAGHGKLAFYLLKSLENACKILNIPTKSLVYVCSDISKKNVQSITEHPSMQQYLNNGMLDVAVFNATKDETIKLQKSQKIISHNTLNKPVFVIGNYIFDTLSNDAFQVKNDKLHEVLIDIKSKASGTEFFKDALYKFSTREVSSDYYEDNYKLNQVLKYYQNYFDEGSFLVPIGGISCIKNIEQLSTHGICLLLADKAVTKIEDYNGLENPDISFHGSVSLTVNFDCLRRYFSDYGDGKAWLMPDDNAEFQVGCFATKADDFSSNFDWEFFKNLGNYTPQDFINLCYNHDEEDDDEELENLNHHISCLNLCMWDPNTFSDLANEMLEIIEEHEITIDQHRALLRGAKLVWKCAFKLEKNHDIPFLLGSLYYALDEFEDAITFYKLSIQWFGINIENSYNLALAHLSLNDKSGAKKMLEQALEINPDYVEAKELLNEV